MKQTSTANCSVILEMCLLRRARNSLIIRRFMIIVEMS